MPRQAPYRGGFSGNAPKRGGHQSSEITAAAATQNNTNSWTNLKIKKFKKILYDWKKGQHKK